MKKPYKVSLMKTLTEKVVTSIFELFKDRKQKNKCKDFLRILFALIFLTLSIVFLLAGYDTHLTLNIIIDNRVFIGFLLAILVYFEPEISLWLKRSRLTFWKLVLILIYIILIFMFINSNLPFNCFIVLILTTISLLTFIFISVPSKLPEKGNDDDPLRDPREDLLNRAELCKNIFDNYIKEGDSNTRIGICGDWGSGKTTCLNFISHYAKAADFPVADFKAWKFNDPEEALQGFIAAIDNGTGDISFGQFKRYKKIINNVFPFIHYLTGQTLLGSIIYDLISAKSHATFNETKQYVSSVLKDELGEKKLLILVDDLDRSSDDIVCQFLMIMREVMDINGCIFVCGFDENHIIEIIKKQNISDEQRYLDKIVQNKIYLPDPTDYYNNKILTKILDKYMPDDDYKKIIRSFDYLLPKNPRNLKKYIRSIYIKHKVHLVRFGQDDLSWDIIYLFELIHNDFPTIFYQIKKDQQFRDVIYKSIENPVDSSIRNSDEWKEYLDKVYQNVETIDRERCSNIIQKIIYLCIHNLIGSEKLSYHIDILSHPELLADKEYKAWIKNDHSSIMDKLLDNNQPTEKRRSFLRKLNIERQDMMFHIAHEHILSEQKIPKEKANYLLNECLWYAQQKELYSGDDPLFNVLLVDEWLKSMLSFKRPVYYDEIIDFREKIIIALAKNSSRFASEFLKKIPIYKKEAKVSEIDDDLLNKVKIIYKKALANKLVESFENGSEDIFAITANASKYGPEYELIFSYNEFFYSQDNIKRITKLSSDANNNSAMGNTAN